VSEFDAQLRSLVDQAWDLRETPYYRDALNAIVDLYDRRHDIIARDHERELDEFARLLCETQVGEGRMYQADTFLHACLSAAMWQHFD
jgi:hypothetical protein